ncbi:MAG: DUF3108 domain-containing protein [Burkholderiales bacterium]|nr:DUF3108 domain-containing protein [Burkholderiales bacterium]
MNEHAAMQAATNTNVALAVQKGWPTQRTTLFIACVVLLVHVWLLAESSLWLTPGAEQTLQTRAFVTRQIQLPPLPNPITKAKPKISPIAKPQPVTDTQTTTNATTTADTNAANASDETDNSPSNTSISSMGNQDQVAPVPLPARVASSVDMQPYPRFASEEVPASEASVFKIPDSVLLKYQVLGMSKQMNYSAWAEFSWQQDGQRYDSKLEVGAFLLGSRSQTSQGTLGVEGLMPQRFGDKYRSEVASHFQRDKGVISFSTNAPEAPLLKGAQDRLSVVMQIAALLSADPERYPVGTLLSFQTVATRDAEVWLFLVEKSETLQLPYGEVPTIKINRKPRKEFDQAIELWFAPSIDYLPVRLRVTNANGDFVDQQLRKLEKPKS